MLERVHVQPELVVVESLIKERVARLATFEDERFARPARVERDPVTGELTVLSEFVTGSRLSDLLEATADAAIVPGVDVALGYLLESLPALTLLHNSGVTHGLIDASRTVLSPDGQVVFLDPVFGSAVERLNLSRLRLWTRFGIASPSGHGPVTFDAASDIAQVALGAVALVLGRNLRLDEYPEALPSLLMEVIEVAQIRGTSGFATGLQRFLRRSLPLPGRRPYATADEAVVDVRQLVRRDIGVDVCRQAVVDFAAQMDAAFSADDDSAATHGHDDARRNPAAHSPRVPELDEFLDSFDPSAQAEPEEPTALRRADTPAIDATDDDSNETEISLDSLETDSRVAPERDTDEIYDLPPLDEVMAEANMLSPAPNVVDQLSIAVATDSPIDEVDQPATPEAAPAFAVAEPEIESPAPAEIYASIETVATAPEVAEPEAAPIVEPPSTLAPRGASPAIEPEPEPEPELEPEPEKDSASSRRRKRQQQKSARARKDKLRSTTAGQRMPPPPPVPQPEPARPASPTGWLVSPQRAAAFEPPVPLPPPAPPPPPPPMRPAPVPAVPSFSPTPVGHLPQPVYPSGVSSTSAYGTSSAPPPAPPGPLAPPPVQQAAQPSVQVKLRAEPPSGFTPRKSLHQEPPTVHVPPERFATLGLGRSDSAIEEEPRAFPWKLAAIAVGVAVIAIFVGRTYLPGRTAVPGEPGAAVDTPAAASSSTPATPVATGDTAIPAGRGRIVVQTQPPGIKVLLDRKPVGETPLTLDVPPGRRILTFLTSGGEIMKSVRVAAGKTESLDVPVFSGWVAVFAPIVVTVAADGRNIGTTEQNRLMLPPGKHQLTFTNKDLGYSATQEVEIVPGEVKSINLDPRGMVNLNAVPWAEVWLDGLKLGDTPLASMSVPLGLREFVFKNPQFGERRVNSTIKAGANSPVTVDFSK